MSKTHASYPCTKKSRPSGQMCAPSARTERVGGRGGGWSGAKIRLITRRFFFRAFWQCRAPPIGRRAKVERSKQMMTSMRKGRRPKTRAKPARG